MTPEQITQQLLLSLSGRPVSTINSARSFRAAGKVEPPNKLEAGGLSAQIKPASGPAWDHGKLRDAAGFSIRRVTDALSCEPRLRCHAGLLWRPAGPCREARGAGHWQCGLSLHAAP